MHREKTNATMALLLERANSIELAGIDPGLESYLSGGLSIVEDGAVVSLAALAVAHADRDQFCDRVDFEAFVNKFHFDDWASEELLNASVEEKLAHTLCLAAHVGARATELAVSIEVIISVDPCQRDIVFRFHGMRSDEKPWLADIDAYAEPVLVRWYCCGTVVQ